MCDLTEHECDVSSELTHLQRSGGGGGSLCKRRAAETWRRSNQPVVLVPPVVFGSHLGKLFSFTGASGLRALRPAATRFLPESDMSRTLPPAGLSFSAQNTNAKCFLKSSERLLERRVTKDDFLYCFYVISSVVMMSSPVHHQYCQSNLLSSCHFLLMLAVTVILALLAVS